MQSNNPVFRSQAFQTYSGNGTAHQGYGQPGYSDPASWSVGTPGGPAGPGAPVSTAPMTIDSVVQKTAISLIAVLAAAAVTWLATPDITDTNADLGPLIGLMTIGSLVAFGLSMVNSFKRVVSPALVLAFAVAQGVALGGLSKFFDAMIGDHIVVQAVIGTFAAFGGTLAAYKFFNIQVGQRFRTFVIAAVFGMVGLSLLELVLGLFGSQLGIFGMGGVGLLFAVVGLVLGVFMLILDFDMTEQFIAHGVPEREAWRIAFALTVSLVWIYTNLLRILAILNQD
ncbi:MULTISPECIES: Bax inhibitor-1/YccA family membrane protein [unclassified Nocardioides]|uniref:Bax inhibitor-1/YccA family protein n=1 Tax=unclassified Nocardioides TaxID=2615069 RepID=UPI00361B3C38